MSGAPARIRVARGPIAGSFLPPGDKSITHRALLLGAMARGTTRILNANPGDDCSRTRRCLAQLGVRVDLDRVEGDGPAALGEPDAVLDCGNSGTTLRLLAGILAARPALAVLAGDSSLNRRPVDRVVEPLRRMGASLQARSGDRFPPLVIRGGALVGIEHRPSVASAQVASSVLFAGLGARGATAVILPGPARDHTERLLPRFGVPVETSELPGGARRVAVTGPAELRATEVSVPGDFSSAAFLLAAAAATPGSRVTARGVSLNPTRTALLDVLEAMGAEVHRSPPVESSGEPAGDVTVTGPERLRAFDVPAAWIPRMVVEIPAWSVAAASAVGTSCIRGAGELRVKESDRLRALAVNLARVGLTVAETPDGLAVTGGTVRGGLAAAAGDHRIAMALAVLGTIAHEPLEVEGAEMIATSYPGFLETLGALGAQVDVRDGGSSTP